MRVGVGVAAGAALCAVLLLSGCVGAARSAGTVTAPGMLGGDTGAGATLKRAEVCATLPVDQVASLTGLPLTVAVPAAAAPPLDLAGCVYSDAEGAQRVTVDVAYGGGTATLAAVAAGPGFDQKTLTPVTGIGTAATESIGAIGVLYGTDVVAATAASDSPVELAALQKLVTTLHDLLA